MKSLSVVVVSLMFLVFTSPLIAQERSFQAEIGLNHSWFNYKFDALNQIGAEFSPQISVGLNYTIYTLDNLSLTGGIRYHDLYRYIDMEPYGFSKGESATFDHYMISVPIQIDYNIKIFNTSAIFNIEPSYILKSKSKSPSHTVAYTFVTQDVTGEMNRFQFALGIGLQYDFNIFKQKFGIKSIYNYLLTYITPDESVYFTDAMGTHSWVQFHTSELNLLLGYYF